jgi:hypothetical protein
VTCAVNPRLSVAETSREEGRTSGRLTGRACAFGMGLARRRSCELVPRAPGVALVAGGQDRRPARSEQVAGYRCCAQTPYEQSSVGDQQDDPREAALPLHDRRPWSRAITVCPDCIHCRSPLSDLPMAGTRAMSPTCRHGAALTSGHHPEPDP